MTLTNSYLISGMCVKFDSYSGLGCDPEHFQLKLVHAIYLILWHILVT